MKPPGAVQVAGRRGGFVRILRRGVNGLLGIFFREIVVSGIGELPEDRGGVLVSWHPNGLIDPALILARLPRRITFGARHGLFKVPLLGSALAGLGTVPIYRAIDLQSMSEERRREANRESLDALAERVAAGDFAALFPEGVSHDQPYLMELKTGAARLYYRARQLRPRGAAPPVILPVGLHYDQKKVFRSRALVWFHAPLRLPAELDRDPAPDESTEEARARARALTVEIARALSDVVHATEDWRTHELLHRVRKLVRAERAKRAGMDPGEADVAEKTIGFARIRAAYYDLWNRDRHRLTELRAGVERYDADLKALGLEDRDLDRSPRIGSPWAALSLLLQVVVVFLFLPAPLLFGYLVNWPATLLVLVVAHGKAKLGKDVATLKILAGSIAYPLTWIAVGILGSLAHGPLRELFPRIPGTPLTAGASLALLAIVGAVLNIRYLQVARETLHAIRIRMTRARRRANLARLSRERAKLYDAIIELGRGIELPGAASANDRAART